VRHEDVDLLISDIGWLITVDPGRRIIHDAASPSTLGLSRSASRLSLPVIYRPPVDAATVATRACRLPPARVVPASRGLADEAKPNHSVRRMYRTRPRSARRAALAARRRRCSSGVTCFVDPGNYHPEASVEGVMSTGIRCLVSRSSFDLTKSVLGILPERMIETTAQALERAEAVLRATPRPATRGCAPAPRSAGSTTRHTN
jgi:5-methylthioadenosine/S-adenosylhomocysteine deaminase